MQEFAFRSLVALAALHHQQVLLGGNIEVGRFEPGHRNGDSVVVLCPAFDIERRVVVALRGGAAGVFQQVEQPVKTYGGTAVGGKIKTVHETNPPMSNLNVTGPETAPAGQR